MEPVKRVAIASTALSMGVNFPDVRYIVLFGPARSLLDFHQEAVRAGQDGLLADQLFCMFMANSWHTVRRTCAKFFRNKWTLFGGKLQELWSKHRQLDRLLVGRGRKQSNCAGFSGTNSREKTADFAGISREFSRPISPKNDRQNTTDFAKVYWANFPRKRLVLPWFEERF